jgi:arylamine N-acetyltransferase
MYRFRDQPHPVDAFTGMYWFHHTSPRSPFGRHWVTTIATATGWTRLLDYTVTEIHPGHTEKQQLADHDELRWRLASSFRLDLPPGRTLRAPETA